MLPVIVLMDGDVVLITPLADSEPTGLLSDQRILQPVRPDEHGEVFAMHS